jgi:ribosome-associated toxin RatA of RatAB toxin-antitoxin module
MAEHTRSSIMIDASPAAVMAVVADFEAYPRWATEVKAVEILSRDETSGRATQVRFQLDAGALRDEHVLAYTWADDERVSWTLVRSQMLKALDGSYTLRAAPGGVEVTYALSVDVRLPMIGMMKRKLEKVVIDRALPGLKRRVEN